ncbi:jacalin-related lectin 16-like [Eucalyptus grandis]|uniref:jacalin-related lectin 16-like n=1 Tax=Eucalyptus grandis TaxID=71139 RepID=UPI00192EDA88|nr:jacalin-related lectin 16-like [Eucalyptus grandis]
MWKHANVRKIVIHIGQKEEDKPDSSAAQKKKKEPSAKTKENRLSGGPFIRSIEFTCEDGGKPETHGSETGLDTKNFLTIELDNGEYLTSISGYYTDHISGRYRDFGITSLTFRTNKRMAITIGEEKGIYFSSPAMAGKITEFYGYIDEHQNLCGIGAYFEPISDQRQFGAWDDGKFDGVREIYLPDKHTIRSFTFVYDNGRGEDRKVTHPAGFSPKNTALKATIL